VQWAALWISGDALAPLAPDRAEQLAGAGLLVAALYQASPLASACQRACARPFAMLARHWHGGDAGRRDAAGLHYGASCVGCCVPMIVLMFVVGMNDLAWMLGLALLMTLQKHAAWGARIALPAPAASAMAGVAIGAGWWMVPLRSMRALCG
jgi:predicted metal-binding membrane protein